jgi:hypothetical protein
MIRSLCSLDRDELTYRVLFVLSMAFAFLQAFMVVRDVLGRVAILMTQVSAVLG